MHLSLRAENEARTRDLNLGKVALYQLSYFRDGTTKVRQFFECPNFFEFFVDYYAIQIDYPQSVQ